MPARPGPVNLYATILLHLHLACQAAQRSFVLSDPLPIKPWDYLFTVRSVISIHAGFVLASIPYRIRPVGGKAAYWLSIHNTSPKGVLGTMLV